MLKIGQLDNELDARTFGDFLYVQGIENQVDPAKDGQWEIWVVHEQQIAVAEKELAAFRANPNDPKYAAGASAEAKRKEDLKRDAAAAPIKLRGRWAVVPTGLPGPATMILMLISVAVFAVQMGGARDAMEQLLSVTTYELGPEGFYFSSQLEEIRQGQLWRLITPIFLHFSILHILFNMMWLRDLGGMVESRKGWPYLIALVVAIAIPSNLAQFAYSGPLFGGMSGVVYGLLGYVWMKSRFDPFSGFYLCSSTVSTSLIWFALCLGGYVGHIANVVHAVGLGMGLACGLISAKLRR